MTPIWIAIAAVALTWWILRLVQAVRADGHGRREPPRSHHDWWDGAAAGSR